MQKQNETRFTMRMNNILYEVMKENAKKNKRSIAKEIEFELDEYNKGNLCQQTINTPKKQINVLR